MTKLTELDKDQVMPLPIEISKREICTPNYEYGFNACVAHNDKLELVIDEEALAKEICKIYMSRDFNSGPSVMMTKHLKSTIGQWAKIGVIK